MYLSIVLDNFKCHCSIINLLINKVILYQNMFSSTIEMAAWLSSKIVVVLARAIYSASAVDSATEDCFLLLQLTASQHGIDM